jgi:hypothetical protein
LVLDEKCRSSAHDLPAFCILHFPFSHKTD